MIDHPFQIFEPYSTQVRVAMFSKADETPSDSSATENIGAKKSAGLEQVHGKKTVIVSDTTNRDIRADGMITSTKNLALCVRWADCQNFVVFDPHRLVLGTLHAGWRGLNSGAIPEFFRVLQERFSVDASDVKIGAGPSLCMQCAEFSTPVEELSHIDASFIHGNCVDLQGAALQQFFTAGVLEKNLERSPDCTQCQSEKYWSYRGGDTEAVKNGKTNMVACYLL